MPEPGPPPLGSAPRPAGVTLLCALLLLLLIPFHGLLVEAWMAARPWSDGLAALSAITVILFLARTPRRGRAGFELPALLFASVLAASAAWNRVPLSALLAGLREQLPWVAVGLLAHRLVPAAHVDRLVRTLVGAAALLAGYGLVSYVVYRSLGGPAPPALPAHPNLVERAWYGLCLYPYHGRGYAGNWHLVSTFQNENYFGVWLVLLAPFALQLTVEEPAGIRRWGRLACLGLLLLALAWTYSRTAFLALVLSTVVCALRRRPRMLLLLIPVALALPVGWSSGESRRFGDVAHTEGGRARTALGAKAVLRRRPLLGAGPGSLRLSDVDYARLATEAGLLGLLSFGWIVVAAVRPGLRRCAGKPDGSRETLLLAGLVAGAGAAVTAGVWENPQVAATYWVFAGLLSVLRQPGTRVAESGVELRGCLAEPTPAENLRDG